MSSMTFRLSDFPTFRSILKLLVGAVADLVFGVETLERSAGESTEEERRTLYPELAAALRNQCGFSCVNGAAQ